MPELLWVQKVSELNHSPMGRVLGFVFFNLVEDKALCEICVMSFKRDLALKWFYMTLMKPGWQIIEFFSFLGSHSNPLLYGQPSVLNGIGSPT